MRLITAVLGLSLLLNAHAFAAGEAPPDVPKPFAEPNLKLPKDSGGKTTSSLITDAPLSTDFAMGKPEAKLVLVEYASMTCPHCAHFASNVVPKLQEHYVETGKIRYVLRQFPLNEPALKAAMLLHCVGKQNPDKYYVFAKVLFDAQNKWAFDTNYMAGLETIATVGGLSKEQFAGCTSGTSKEMELLKLKKQATDELKVPHTPYIFVGDEVFTGDRNFETLSKFIDKKLAEIGAK